MHLQSYRRIVPAILAIAIVPTMAVGAAEVKLTVTDCPAPGLVFFRPDAPLEAKASYVLQAGGQSIPAQVDADGRLWWYQPESCTGDGRAYTLAIGSADKAGGIKVEKTGEGVIDVTIDDKPFTAFNYGGNSPKPFLYPVIGPTGSGVTRNYPMKKMPEEHGRQDHPHHRSIWTAYGDVRLGDFGNPGTDYWTVGKNKGVQKVTRIVRAVGGPVFGVIEADVDWINPAGKKEFSETRTYRFYKDGRDQRIIDLKVAFKFTEGDVMFADTKEGGIVSLRVAVTMDESAGGKMYNSPGQIGEDQCWGRPADWCDYVGPVDGQTVGIAVFDAKTNFGHPTSWHIRGYGLYTANPFGLQAFGQKKSGSHVFKKGETAEFNYRILIHKGDPSAAHVAEQYAGYSQPAKVMKTSPD